MGGWPMPVVFDTTAAGLDRHWLGRNHPVVAAASEAILGEAFDGRSEPPIVARCAVTVTDAVTRVTWLPLLRLRWRLEEGGVDGFAEEIRLAAVEDADGTLRILEPLADAGRELAARVRARGRSRRRRAAATGRRGVGRLKLAPGGSRSWICAGTSWSRHTVACAS